jgi:CHRD domain-containing protein
MDHRHSARSRALQVFCGILAATTLATFAMVQAAGADEKIESRHFSAEMTGAQQVPAVQTNGEGDFIAELSRDGKRLDFILTADDLSSNILAAHIHVGAKGTNGPIVAFLFAAPTAAGVSGGHLFHKGSVTAANLIGPLAGHPLSDLVSAMRAGNTYANTHTVMHPGGEVRGQITDHHDQDHDIDV